MLQIPTWKRIVIWSLCALAILFAIPNAFYGRVENHNDARAAVAEQGTAPTPEQQAAIDGWPNWMPSSLMNLGLDLRGGAHLLAEVRLAEVYADRVDALWPEMRDALRDARAEVGGVRRVASDPGTLRIQISNPEGMARAVQIAQGLAQPIQTLTGTGQSDLDVQGQGDTLTIQLSEAERTATDQRTMQQSLEIIRRRVDEVGTREPTIQRQGDDRILIEVPGIGSADELKALIGTTAQLTFNSVVSRTADANAPVEAGQELLPSENEPGVFYIVQATPVVSGEQLVDAQPAFDQNNAPAVNFRFNGAGGRIFGDYTAQNIGRPFAIVLDDQVISAPVINSAIPGGSGIITGNFTVEDSTELAVLLRAGALPAGMDFLEERTIGPELGQDSIDAGRMASIIGMVAVVVFMVACYGWFGMIANIALTINVIAIFAVLSLLGATLTLPGIAGIVLTMGTAVDANVLIFERVREELRAGRNPVRALDEGFQKALSAIIDANITTLLTAIIMFAVGSGPVRGFAVTLGIGIITSMFTSVFVARSLIATWYAWRRPKTITV
ncbi:protein translocase subunit SecD [Falsirhodobacter sp. 20TX0035]|uniref:protein translocase subunit SecD n=1 Tax=Falsirhodobacter sp. 20TX0035 TaxID=3022019 RepID=UPI00232B26F6|nr:protein translocase subunit SecD [Falsirhodobacter sp. 20TX0035]MDB6453130.1 protein translocase subunit SecD [Falsirhodobacter sp. 20TX0035]